MKKLTLTLATIGLLTVLSGCKEEKPVDVVQSVEWYTEHKTERAEVLAKCQNNPGELANTPNCVNASRADSAITWGAKGAGVKVKPLTAEDMKLK